MTRKLPSGSENLARTPKALASLVKSDMPDSISIDDLTRALRRARPDTTPGTFNPSQANAVGGQRVGWRSTVLAIADTLTRTVPGFDRDAFNAACGTTTNGR